MGAPVVPSPGPSDRRHRRGAAAVTARHEELFARRYSCPLCWRVAVSAGSVTLSSPPAPPPLVRARNSQGVSHLARPVARERFSFSKLREVLDLPDLVAVQRESFAWFIGDKDNVDPDRRKTRPASGDTPSHSRP